MKAWQIAAGEKPRTLSRHIDDKSQLPADKRYIEQLQYKFQRWEKRKNRHSNCTLCEKNGKKNTTGYLPGIGAIMKCQECQEEYADIRRSLQMLADDAPE